MPPLHGVIASFTPLSAYRVVCYTGNGREGDPYRYVTFWFESDGKFIAIYDPCDKLTFVNSFEHGEH